MTAPTVERLSTARRSQCHDHAFRAWLTESCQRQGVPLTITDPTVINQVAVLLKH
ncbi:hypothetical protein [Jongsikchunia kroppenstedtii]|uniref:hypothetical protein n=1 Tax=Jongsikchunia kroppenstedtii TaxID=1121721 RepID=UPI00039FE95E|nr:hypothetical protein [Jongsikchunia kroppenstedtii]